MNMERMTLSRTPRAERGNALLTVVRRFPISKIIRAISLALLTSACTLSLIDLPGLVGTTPTPESPDALQDIPTPLPQAEIKFRVEVPEETPTNETIFLNVLDEVTGLALNPRSFRLEPDGEGGYQINFPAPVDSVVKYRYSRQGAGNVLEHTSDGRPVRYRLYRVDGPGEVQDRVSRWTDTLYSAPSGRITGRITDAESGDPIPNLLVTAGGAQTITSADGSYLLEGLPPATHNLVVYAMDGAYKTFQQGAIVADASTTPASLKLTRADLIELEFVVVLPDETIPGIPVRIAGNMAQFGNTYADLSGGINTVANRMPLLSQISDGRFSLKMTLPAGADLRYRYTYGDGFWNAEHTADGETFVRQLIVPDRDHVVEDTVASWRSGNSAPIWFDVNVPESTPTGDRISIQFNPYGWTQPIPMWFVGENRWVYLLTSPLDVLGTIGYRYCRNDQCGSADDRFTPGDQSGGRPFRTSVLPQTLKDTVNNWQWVEAGPGPITVPSTEIPTRGSSFVAGVEFLPYFHPTWLDWMDEAIGKVDALNANWLIFTPTWSYTRSDPPVLEQVPGQDPLWPDLIQILEHGEESGLSLALRPVPNFPFPQGQWWVTGTRDTRWWDAWFNGYRRFMIHHADLAAQQNMEALILGGEWLLPALPGGTLADGSASGVPEDADQRWRDLIREVRSHFRGTLIWALPYPSSADVTPAFLIEFDQLMILWDAPLAQASNADGTAMGSEAVRRLDNEVLLIFAQFNKPMIISVAYPSADGGVTGCLPDPDDGCLDAKRLSPPNSDIPIIDLDLNEQAEAYTVMLQSISEREWLTGFISRGYYPPAALQDTSISVNGKPAADVLSYWFPRLLGTAE